MKSKRCSAGFGSQCPADETHVSVYFLQQGASADEAEKFLSRCQAKQLKNPGGKLFENWKRLAWTWIWYGADKCNV